MAEPSRGSKRYYFHNKTEPPLRIGDIIKLNSGGPNMLVVDVEKEKVIAAWKNPSPVKDGKSYIIEAPFYKIAVHRVRTLW